MEKLNIIIKKFEQLIFKYSIEEVIDEIREFLSNSEFDSIYRDFILISAQYHTASSKYHIGIINNPELVEIENKVRFSLLILLKRLKDNTKVNHFSFLEKFKVAAQDFNSRFKRYNRYKLAYIDPYSINEFNESKGPISLEISSLINNPSYNNSIIILGEFGTGKTTFSYNFCHTRVNEWLGNRFKRLPFVFQFKNCSYEIDLEDWIIGEINKETNIEISKKDFLEAFYNNKLIIILDGLDELPFKNNLELKRNIIRDVIRFAGKGSPVIITSRINFFEGELELKDTLGKFDIFYLKKFGIDQVMACLGSSVANRFDGNFKDNFEKMLRANKALFALSKRPLFLQMIFDLYSSNMSLDNVNNQADLYSKLINEYILRELRKNPSEFTSSTVKKVIRMIALEMFKKNKHSYEKEDFEKLIESIISDLSWGNNPKTSHLKTIVSRCLLIRQNSKDSRYKFSHFSFLEYLVSEGLAFEIIESDFKEIEKRIYYEEIFDFLEMVLKNKGKFELIYFLLEDSSMEFKTRVNVIPMVRENFNAKAIKTLISLIINPKSSPVLRWVSSYSILVYLDKHKLEIKLSEFDSDLITKSFNNTTNSLIQHKIGQILSIINVKEENTNELQMFNSDIKSIEEIALADGIIEAHEIVLLRSSEHRRVICASIEILTIYSLYNYSYRFRASLEDIVITLCNISKDELVINSCLWSMNTLELFATANIKNDKANKALLRHKKKNSTDLQAIISWIDSNS